MGRVIMLSGPVGAGKTTVARELVSILPEPLSYIEGDTFWSFIKKSKGRDRRENFRTIMRAIRLRCPDRFFHSTRVLEDCADYPQGCAAGLCSAAAEPSRVRGQSLQPSRRQDCRLHFLYRLLSAF